MPRSSLSPGAALLSLGNPKQVLPDVGAWAWLAQDEHFTWMDLPAPNPGGKDAALGCNRGFPHAHHPVQPQLAYPDPPQPQEPTVPAPAQIVQQHCLETNKILQWVPVPRPPPLPWLCPALGSMSGVSAVSHRPLPVLTRGWWLGRGAVPGEGSIAAWGASPDPRDPR